MTQHFRTGDPTLEGKMYLELTLKATIANNDLAGCMVPIPLETIYIPSEKDMAIIAGLAKQHFIHMKEARESVEKDS